MTRLPPLWIMIFIIGLPQLSETVYTPSLPDIAHFFQTSDSMVEYTLTIYLLGFACGTLFWGKISDRLGRKPCIIAGMVIFALACIGCYNSPFIEILMLSRFIQAFGGSVGSVLGQAVLRDSFEGQNLSKMYATAGSILSAFPAFGPVIGGFIAEKLHWQNIFLFLLAFSSLLSLIIYLRLPETHSPQKRQNISVIKTAIDLFHDKKVLCFALIVGCYGGIQFSYYSEAPFYLIELLGLSPSEYGTSFILIGFFIMLGGLFSRTMQKHRPSKQIMDYGIMIVLVSSIIFSIIAITGILHGKHMIYATIICYMITSFGICTIAGNALALSLLEYKHCIGTASSIFGFIYYCITSLCTLLMGMLHNGTLLPMPLYFTALAAVMFVTSKVGLRQKG